MEKFDRRRFLTISAAAAGALSLGENAMAEPLYRWRGTALGASASIIMRHPEAERLVRTARSEISRLEAIFSLNRPDSVLMNLNRDSRLAHPPLELLEVLGLCDVVHAESKGLFDPSIQPLWQTYATHYSNGRSPDDEAIASALSRVGWHSVVVSPTAIAFEKQGMALTLNGVAQGYIADRVAGLLAEEGLTDILVDTGEMRAMGGHPHGGGWLVAFTQSDSEMSVPSFRLKNTALASSAPFGTVFDSDGKLGHIINPLTGSAAMTGWRLVSVTAPRAALADALTTAMCLMTRDEMDAVVSRFPGVRLVHLA